MYRRSIRGLVALAVVAAVLTACTQPAGAGAGASGEAPAPAATPTSGGYGY